MTIIASWMAIQVTFKLPLHWRIKRKLYSHTHTYAYKHMPFGLCNVATTFQRCMLSIFSDMVERNMEVFMDNLTVYGKTFDECLLNLKKVLKMCIEEDLVLN